MCYGRLIGDFDLDLKNLCEKLPTKIYSMKNYNSHLWILILMQVTCAYADNVIQVKIVGAAKIGLEKETENLIFHAGKENHFHVFYFCKTEKAVELYDPDCSSGHNSLTFEATNLLTNKTYIIRRAIEVYSGNVIGLAVVSKKFPIALSVNLIDGTWSLEESVVSKEVISSKWKIKAKYKEIGKKEIVEPHGDGSKILKEVVVGESESYNCDLKEIMGFLAKKSQQ